MTLKRRPMDTSPFAVRILPNGLRAVAIGRPGTSTVASKLFLKAGSRHDGEQHGIGHCLEHALFRGTTTRSGQEVYSAIEDLGGRIQGETVKDYLALGAVTAARGTIVLAWRCWPTCCSTRASTARTLTGRSA